MTYTKDQIMAMTAYQLNRAIAEAKGWRLLITGSEVKIGKTVHKPPTGWFDRNGARAELPEWSRDIAAAWKLVEEMINNNERPQFCWNGDEWVFVSVRFENWDNHARGETAPLALSRAWLLWKVEAK